MSVRLAIVTLLCTSRIGQSDPSEDMAHISQPILELRLAPPKHPQPQVVAELAVLDAARDKLEARFMKGLGGKYIAALDDAKARINALIKRSFGAAHFDVRKRAGFLRVAERFSSPAGFGIKVKLFPVPATDASIQARMDDLDHKLSITEWNTLNQAGEDFPHITDVVLNELAIEINTVLNASANARAHASFLELASLANVRVASAKQAFPTVRGLVEEMEHRRDKAESAVMAKVLELETKLVTSEITYAVHAMRAAVS